MEARNMEDSEKNQCEPTNNLENYLLILPCSNSKKNITSSRVIDIYDGPVFQIPRKCNSNNIDLLILSEKYGIHVGTKIISSYDLKMTPERARILKHKAQFVLRTYLKINNYRKILINLGKNYRFIVECCNFQPNVDVKSEFLYGLIGLRIKNLKNCLLEIRGK